MIDKDVLLAKTGVIQRCLLRIREVTRMDPESIDDINVQDIFVLNLQRAIQAAVDIAVHIIAMEGWGVPATLKAHFDRLCEKNIIDRELANRLKAMVGFRNIAVHDYRAIELTVLKMILANNLKDLERFYNTIFCHYKISNGV